MSKRLWGVILSIVLILTGCSGDEDATTTTTEAPRTKPSVVVTTTQLGNFVDVVAADLVDLYVVGGPNTDPATYEPTSQDITALARADIIFRNGVGMEPWFDQAVDSRFGGLIVDTSTGVQIRNRTYGEDSIADPHIWLSVTNARQMVANVTNALADQDPESAVLYQSSQRAYGAQLESLALEIRRNFSSLSNRSVVTAHDGFGYFTEEFDLDYLGSANGSLDADAQPSAEHTQAMVQAIRDVGVPAIFAEASIDRSAVFSLAAASGVNPIAGPNALHVDALGSEGSGAETYLQMMRQNANILANNID